MPPFVSSFPTSTDDVKKFEYSSLHFKYRILVVKSTFVKHPIYIAKKDTSSMNFKISDKTKYLTVKPNWFRI